MLDAIIMLQSCMPPTYLIRNIHYTEKCFLKIDVEQQKTHSTNKKNRTEKYFLFYFYVISKYVATTKLKLTR